LKNPTKFTNPAGFGIREIDTGFNSKYAYGTATRKVCMGRGNR
jgi:ankyrin repeat protein